MSQFLIFNNIFQLLFILLLTVNLQNCTCVWIKSCQNLSITEREPYTIILYIVNVLSQYCIWLIEPLVTNLEQEFKTISNRILHMLYDQEKSFQVCCFCTTILIFVSNVIKFVINHFIIFFLISLIEMCQYNYSSSVYHLAVTRRKKMAVKSNIHDKQCTPIHVFIW